MIGKFLAYLQAFDWRQCVLTLGVALIVLLLLIMIQVLVRRLWRRKWSKHATETRRHLYELVRKRVFPLLYFGVVYLTVRSFSLPGIWGRLLDGLALLVFLSSGAGILLSLLGDIMGRKILRRRDENYRKLFRILNTVVRVVVWIVAALILFDNLGVKVSGLLAGLGIGGVAVALASQAILGDLFSYVTIFLDKPFEQGDFIIVGDFLGSVEKIGIKTTRLRSLSGEEIVMSNTDLTGSRIRNYKRMERRRVVFRLGVVYETPVRVLKEIPLLLRRIVEETPGTVFDRSHFESYGDFSLNFETVYYVLSNDYNRYMDIHQSVNLRVKETFERKRIEFAYPTRVVIGQNARPRRPGRREKP